jgi:hypothetical protein
MRRCRSGPVLSISFVSKSAIWHEVVSRRSSRDLIEPVELLKKSPSSRVISSIERVLEVKHDSSCKHLGGIGKEVQVSICSSARPRTEAVASTYSIRNNRFSYPDRDRTKLYLSIAMKARVIGLEEPILFSDIWLSHSCTD